MTDILGGAFLSNNLNQTFQQQSPASTVATAAEIDNTRSDQVVLPVQQNDPTNTRTDDALRQSNLVSSQEALIAQAQNAPARTEDLTLNNINVVFSLRDGNNPVLRTNIDGEFVVDLPSSSVVEFFDERVASN
ncbi:MAG: hypothetical protein AAF403_05370 [Pseudomonadota bacterium]